MRDDRDIGSERFGGESNFHKLKILVSSSPFADKVCKTTSGEPKTHLLLLHQLGVGAVVDNIASEDGGGQDGVDILSVDVLELSIEDEIVSSRANSHGSLLAEENESENVAILLTER